MTINPLIGASDFDVIAITAFQNIDQNAESEEGLKGCKVINALVKKKSGEME